MKLGKDTDLKLGVQISPLIDVVFLLLIYFMVAATLIRKEAGLAFALPSPGNGLAIPVEVRVEIAADGTVEVDGMRFAGNDRSLNTLATQISKLKSLAAAQHSLFFVNITPHKETLHRRVIDVMDACAEAGVGHLAFSKSL